MRYPFKAMILMSVLLGFMTACSAESEPIQKGESLTENSIAEEAFQVVEQNNEAANEKNVDAFVATYVKDMQDNARKQVEKAFEETDFKHELSSPKVMEESEERVVLSVIQTTTDLAGDNDVITDIVEHELIKENDEFKIKLSRPGE